MPGTPIVVSFAANTQGVKSGIKTITKDLKKFSVTGPKLLGAVGKAVVGLAAGATAFAATGVKAFTDFERRVREVATLLGNVGDREVKELGNTIQEVMADFGASGETATKAFYDSLSAGVPKEQADKFVRTAAKLAEAAAVDVSVSVDLMTSAFNAFKLEGDEVNQAADTLFSTVRYGKTTLDEIAAAFSHIGPPAAAAGVSIHEVTSWLATLTLSGTPTRQAGTQIKAALAELSRPTTKLGSLFKELSGKEFPKFIQQGGSLEEALKLISDEAQRSGRSMFSMSASIESAQGFMGVTEQKYQLFQRVLNDVGDSAGSVETAFGIMADSADFKMRQFKETIGNLQKDLGAALVPALLAVLPAVIPVIEAFANFASELLINLIPALQPLIDALLPVAIELLTAMTPLAVAVAVALSEIAVPLGNLIQSLMPALVMWVEHSTRSFERIVPYIQDFVGRIADFTDSNPQVAFIALGVAIGATLIPKIVALGTALLALAANPVVLIVGAIAGLAVGVVAAYKKFEGFRNVVDAVANWFQNTLWPLLKTVGEAIVAYFSGPFITQVTAVWDTVKSTTESVVRWFQDWVLPTLVAVYDGIAAGVRGFWSVAKPVFQAVIDFIEGPFWTVFSWLADQFVWFHTQIIRLLVGWFLELKTYVFEPLVALIKTVVIPVIKFLYEAFVSSFKNGILPMLKLVWKGAELIFKAYVAYFKHVFVPAVKLLWTVFREVFVERIGPALIKVWEKVIRPVLTALVTFFRRPVTNTLNAIDLTVKTVFNSIKFVITSTVNGIKKILQSLIGFLGGAVTKAWNTLKTKAIDPVIGALQTVISWVQKAIDALGKIPTPGSIIDGAKGFIGKMGGILPFAEGGIVTKPTIGLVGEAGPEAIIPLGNAKLGQALGASIGSLSKIIQGGPKAVSALASVASAYSHIPSIGPAPGKKYSSADDMYPGTPAWIRMLREGSPTLYQQARNIVLGQGGDIHSALASLGVARDDPRMHDKQFRPFVTPSLVEKLTESNLQYKTSISKQNPGRQINFGPQGAYFADTGKLVPEMAKGGIITSPTLALVGEAGPEAVVPLGKVNKGSAEVTINIYGGMATSAEIGEKVEEALQKWSAHRGGLELNIR